MDLAEQAHLLAGRYRLGPVIGRGGMGTVWQARDELLNRDVAVKEIVLPPYFSDAERETARNRAVREAQMAARLHHPNVVGIYDIIEEDGRPWIVMELLPYPSLRDVVTEDGPLDPVRAAQLGLGALAALRAAHMEGIVHRDVKPGNILVGPGERAVLTDFGIARAADSTALTTSGMLIGSPSYMAPERARGGQAGPAVDLWGLGASLYTAVEGRPPFEREGALASLTAVVADEPDPAVHAGPLWPVISGLLRKDPDKRLGTAETERMLRAVVAHGAPAPARAELTGWLESPELVAPEPVLPAPAADPPARRPRAGAFATLVAAVIVIAAAATAIALTIGNSPKHPTASTGGAHRSVHPSATQSPRPTTPSSAAATPSNTPAATPSNTPAGTPSNTPSQGAGYGALPAGFYQFTNSTGFSIAVPRGWLVSHVGHYVYIRDPADSGVFLLIDQSDHPKPNPLADWEQQQADRASGYPGYHLIRLESVRYPQAEAAADWEFTYDRNGVLVHILNRNVLANSQHAYALYWSTPESDWAADYHYFQAFAATFKPAP
jgi:eukaryotic-like serine/threonine-protein kinase